MSHCFSFGHTKEEKREREGGNGRHRSNVGCDGHILLLSFSLSFCICIRTYSCFLSFSPDRASSVGRLVGWGEPLTQYHLDWYCPSKQASKPDGGRGKSPACSVVASPRELTNCAGNHNDSSEKKKKKKRRRKPPHSAKMGWSRESNYGGCWLPLIQDGNNFTLYNERALFKGFSTRVAVRVIPKDGAWMDENDLAHARSKRIRNDQK